MNGVSFVIPVGGALALIGESGCGKTSIAKAVLQLIRPSGGEVEFDGQDLCSLDASQLRLKRKEMQIIFQNPYASLNPDRTIGSSLTDGLRAFDMCKNRREERRLTHQLLADVGLDSTYATRYPDAFSGGQRQRVAIARALSLSPKLVVCDEPTSALDVSIQAQILNLLKDLQEKRGLSYLFITHNTSVVEYITNEVAVMYLGKIVEGAPSKRC